MKDDLFYIDHCLSCIHRVEEYIADGEQAFYDQSLIQDAVLRNLQVLAESTKRLSDQIKRRHSSIPWGQIVGFRNILVHDYLGVDLRYVWEVVALDLPLLRKQLELVRSSLSL